MSGAVALPEEETAIDLSTLIDGIFKFHRELTGHEFYGYQHVFCRRIIESVLLNDGATITGLWSRQSGKTTAVAELIITLAVILPVLAHAFPDDNMLKPFKGGVLIGIFAPIEHQAGLSYNKMRNIIGTARAKEILEDDEIATQIATNRGDTLTLKHTAIEMVCGEDGIYREVPAEAKSSVWARTASPNSKVEGETFHIILIDEAQDVDRFKVDKEIEPMRAATNGTLVKVGTANLQRGGFKSDIEYNEEAFRLKKAPRNHFQFDYRVVVAERRLAYKRDGDPSHLRYEKYVETQRRKAGGEKSLSFRLNFLLEWQISQKDAISARAVLSAEDFTRELNAHPSVEQLEASKEHRELWVRVGGLDIAKENDSTVATAMEYDANHPVIVKDDVSGEIVKYHPKRIAALLEIQGLFEDTPDEKGQYTKVVKFFRDWGVEYVTMDSTGMGNPVHERFQTLAPEITWFPFKFSAPSNHNLFKYYVDEWEAGRVKIASGGEKDEDGHTASQNRYEHIEFFIQHKNLEKEMKGIYAAYHAPKALKDRPGQDEDEYHDDYCTSGALATWAVKNHILQEVRFDTPGSGIHTRRRGSMTMPVSRESGPTAVPVTTRVSRADRYRRRR